MKIRRVVTADDKDGKSYVKWDSEIEGVSGRSGHLRFPMWATNKLPVELTDEDPTKWEIGTTIPGGSVFRLSQYEPGVAARWHRTDSVDYALVVSGEMWMQMDKGEVHLKAGDVVIQRGTMHNWVNRGKEPCLMLYVLIATEEKGKAKG
ncbi:MAG: cupin domain-containing protein [Chloroflexota bacterium]